MAISFTVSYTFSPSTTISSSQVNTNFSDNSAVWQGLEALTKTFAKLKVDVDPSTALEVATKQYVDHYSAWRKPNLQFGSVTTVAVESGLDGTSGDIPLLFSDGSVRTETSTTRTTFNITRNAVLTTSGAQSGLRTGLSEGANTWYALYGVKVTDSSTLWCTVGDTTLPIQANYATLNTRYGTSGWFYLGLICNGDNASATGDILAFTQAGNFTKFQNLVTTTGSASSFNGILLLDNASTANLTWTYAAGTAAATQIPNNITIGYFAGGVTVASARVIRVTDNNGAGPNIYAGNTTPVQVHLVCPPGNGLAVATTGNEVNGKSFTIAGFWDSAIGVGSNPLI